VVRRQQWVSNPGTHRNGSFAFVPEDSPLNRTSRLFPGAHGREAVLVDGATPVHKRRPCTGISSQPSEQVGSSSKMLLVRCLAVYLPLLDPSCWPSAESFIALTGSVRAHRDAAQQVFTESYSAYKFVHLTSSHDSLIHFVVVSGSLL
jgi:hypothetical protein